MQLILPREPLFILAQLSKAGFEAYIVGGAVRDLLRNTDNKKKFDYDITTNARPEKIQQIFPESFYENDFGTVAISSNHLREQMGLTPIVTESKPEKEKIINFNQATKLHQSLSLPQKKSLELELPNFEITTFRSDEVYTNHRRPEKLSWGNSIEQDLSRRDFTINALAIKINQPELFLNSTSDELILLQADQYQIIDLFDGLLDLQNHLIRTVGKSEQRFNEDALRMLRAIRFSVQLNMQIEDQTFEAILNQASLIKHISWERISQELLKILASDYPAEGIELLDRTGLLSFIMPELIQGKGVEQAGHHDTDVWTHSLDALRTCPSTDPIVRLSTLLHDIGKPQTYQVINGNITFYNHEIVGSRIAKKIGQRLKLSKAQIDKIFILVRYHMFYYQPQNSDASIRRFMRKVGLENLDDILALREGDRLGSGAKRTSWRLEEMKQRMIDQLHQPMDVTDLAINGHDLMEKLNLSAGPILGELLHFLLDQVLENPALNQPEQLLKLCQNYLKDHA